MWEKRMMSGQWQRSSTLWCSLLLQLSLSALDQTEKLTVSSRPSPEGLAKRLRQSSERLSSWTVSHCRNERTGLATFLLQKRSSWRQQSFCCSLGHSAHLCPLSWSWQNIPYLCSIFSWLIKSFNCICALPNKKTRKSCFFLMKFLVWTQKISNCFIDLFCFVLLLKH